MQEAHEQLAAELRRQFPLLEKLRFVRNDEGQPEKLPPVVAILAAMTDPVIPGDICALVPSRARVTAFTAVLTALSAVRDHFPDLLKKYISEGFAVGERVRVLPSGHVYEFGGYFEAEYGDFFKLKFVDDETNGSRAFPIKEAVRLEKTNYKIPKGRGDSDWGKFKISKLDFIVGTRTGGNQALLANEVMLVATQSEFLEFLQQVKVSRADQPNHAFPLSEVIPWGTVNPDGEIEFQKGRTAGGEPVIAVSPRAEYIAAACRKSGRISPRVVVDGTSRIKDLQAFDDIVDYSKLLVLADHSEVDQLPELAERECTVWKMPDNLGVLVGQTSGLLEGFRQAYHRAANFKFKVAECESAAVDRTAEKIFLAEKLLREEGHDESVLKIIGIAFSRLLDISSIVHDPQKAELNDLHKLVLQGKENLAALQMWINPEALAMLEEAFQLLEAGLQPDAQDFRSGKQLRLLEIVDDLQSSNADFAVVGANNLATESAKSLLHANIDPGVKVASLAELSNGQVYDELVLTGWPRARNFSRLVNSYRAQTINALAYGFEREWFSGGQKKRAYKLSRWAKNAEEFQSLTGLSFSFQPDTAIREPEPVTTELDRIVSLERRLGAIRKGGQAGNFSDSEARRARYVSFAGHSYSFLTETHKIPRITDLVRGASQKRHGVPLVNVEALVQGDLVLFRGHTDTDKDMIRLIAEELTSPGEYERVRVVAESWKELLRSIGDTSREIWERLSAAGLKKHEQTIRLWLTDPDLIGPGDEADLYAVADAAGDDDFKKRIPDVWAAIASIRGVHITAGFKLGQLLFSHLPAQLPEIGDTETFVDLSSGEIPIGQVVIVQVEAVSEESELRPYWEVNRLLWDEI